MQVKFRHLAISDVIEYSDLILASGQCVSTVRVLVQEGLRGEDKEYASYTGDACANKKSAQQSAAARAIACSSASPISPFPLSASPSATSPSRLASSLIEADTISIPVDESVDMDTGTSTSLQSLLPTTDAGSAAADSSTGMWI
jgi:hypothetical protein